jgi:hypothetical protein
MTETSQNFIEEDGSSPLPKPIDAKVDPNFMSPVTEQSQATNFTNPAFKKAASSGDKTH